MLSDYTYLIGALMIVALWALLFYFRKDLRKEMLFMSSGVAILGVIMEAFFWTKDWWQPQTFTGTIVGIEDALFGFGIGGVSAVAYETAFRKRLPKLRTVANTKTKSTIAIVLLAVAVGSFLHFYIGASSVTSWLISISIATAIIWYVRPDLIVDSVFTGLTLTIIAFAGFAVMNIVQPGFVHEWWLLDELSRHFVLGVPLEDVLWFFTAGMFIGPLYEFWRGKKWIRI